MKKLIVVMLVALISVPVFAQDWTTTSDTDEMTGEVTSYAMSPYVTATKSMSFPYRDVESRLSVGYNGSQSWVYLYFTTAPNLSNTNTEDGYNHFSVRIKWDTSLENEWCTQDWGSKFIHFAGNDESIVTSIKQHNNVKVELDWHGEGSTIFEYSLKGSTAALKKIGVK